MITKLIDDETIDSMLWNKDFLRVCERYQGFRKDTIFVTAFAYGCGLMLNKKLEKQVRKTLKLGQKD